jgi:hypothetical protein
MRDCKGGWIGSKDEADVRGIRLVALNGVLEDVEGLACPLIPLLEGGYTLRSMMELAYLHDINKIAS